MSVQTANNYKNLAFIGNKSYLRFLNVSEKNEWLP